MKNEFVHFYFFTRRGLSAISKKPKRIEKHETKIPPLLGGEVYKMIGFKSMCCSRQKFRCLQKVLLRFSLEHLRGVFERRLQLITYFDYDFFLIRLC